VSRLLAPLHLTLLVFTAASCGQVATSEPLDEVPDDSRDGSSDDPAPLDCGEDETRLDLNDVSMLFPLPATAEGAEDLLGMSAEGRHGPLLPRQIFEALPAPLSRFPDVPTYESLRVVAARVDPCFPAAGGSGCRRQLRLVVQPLLISATAVQTVDATLHLFYDLSDEQFAGLLVSLFELKSLAGSETFCRPLGVHPVMQREGLGGAYAARLGELILDHGGADNLRRVAVMQLSFPGSSWRFSSFDVQGEGLDAVSIPRLSAADQQDFLLSDTEEDRGALVPAPPGSGIPLLVDALAIEGAGDDALAAAAGEVHAIEDPHRESPLTVDCVSCHVSGRALDFARSIRAIDGSGEEPPYRNAYYDLSVIDDGERLTSQRAFGYFGDRPSLSRRVVHESAEIAAALAAAGPP
jgi:hypothetical protein